MADVPKTKPVKLIRKRTVSSSPFPQSLVDKEYDDLKPSEETRETILSEAKEIKSDTKHGIRQCYAITHLDPKTAEKVDAVFEEFLSKGLDGAKKLPEVKSEASNPHTATKNGEELAGDENGQKTISISFDMQEKRTIVLKKSEPHNEKQKVTEAEESKCSEEDGDGTESDTGKSDRNGSSFSSKHKKHKHKKHKKHKSRDKEKKRSSQIHSAVVKKDKKKKSKHEFGSEDRNDTNKNQICESRALKYEDHRKGDHVTPDKPKRREEIKQELQEEVSDRHRSKDSKHKKSMSPSRKNRTHSQDLKESSKHKSSSRKHSTAEDHLRKSRDRKSPTREKSLPVKFTKEESDDEEERLEFKTDSKGRQFRHKTKDSTDRDKCNKSPLRLTDNDEIEKKALSVFDRIGNSLKEESFGSRKRNMDVAVAFDCHNSDDDAEDYLEFKVDVKPKSKQEKKIENFLVKDAIPEKKSLVDSKGKPGKRQSVAADEGPFEKISKKEEGEEEEKKKSKKIILNLGLKISETSAALISSGVKVDKDNQVINREEGEISDSNSTGSSSSGEGEVGETSSDGEISEEKDPDMTSKTKKKKKKHKKKKSKKHSSRSKTPKTSSRSRSRERSSSGFDKVRGVWRSDAHRDEYRSRSRDHRRSRSRERDYHRRGRSRSRSRERDREPWRHDRFRDNRSAFSRRSTRSREREDRDLRVKIDKAKLREIAIKNAYKNMKHGGTIDFTLKPDELAVLKAGGKSIDELTNFCKRISDKDRVLGQDSDSDDSDKMKLGSDEEDAPFIHHPFKVRETASIVMNIRNAKQLPVLTPSEKAAQSSTLRLTYPVSSGGQHKVGEEWVPVQKTTATPAPVPPPSGNTATTTTTSTPTSTTTTLALPPVPPPPPPPPELKVFPDPPTKPVNIGQVVSDRLSALRKLQENPHDVQAIGTVYKAQQAMNEWASSKTLPGQFTGSTGVQVLSQRELIGHDPKRQAWLRKDQFIKAEPLKTGIGKFLLTKMGWKEGEGLGKNNEGTVDPLLLDIKMDRKGLASIDENSKKGAAPFQRPNARVHDLSGKHPVSALVELCNKKRWASPDFTLVHESGPAHKKNFLFKVKVNGTEFQSSIASNNKKHAKMQAATSCLQELGLVPRDATV